MSTPNAVRAAAGLGELSEENQDDYEHLGPEMRARLNQAEDDLAKVRNWLSLQDSHPDPGRQFTARELRLMLGWPDVPVPERRH